MRRPSLVIVVAPTSVAAERTMLKRLGSVAEGWQQPWRFGMVACGGVSDFGGDNDWAACCAGGEWTGVVAHPTRVAIATAAMMNIIRIGFTGR